MRIRTKTELIESICPNCCEANYGGESYCRNCGTMLISGCTVTDGATEADMKELATAHRAAIVSKTLPAHNLNFNDIFAILFAPLILLLASLVPAVEEGENVEGVLICGICLLPIYCICLYVIIAGPKLEQTILLRDGISYPAVVIGHGNAMLHDKTSSKIDDRSIFSCIKVLTKIAGVDTSIVVYVPDEITDHTCPLGTEVTIIGRGERFILDPDCRKRLIRNYRMNKAGKTD